MRTREIALDWIGALGGALIWALHLVVSYAIVGVGCQLRVDERALAFALVIATAVAAAAATVTVLVALRSYRSRPPWRRFLGAFGLLFGTLSVASILFAGVLPAFLPACMI